MRDLEKRARGRHLTALSLSMSLLAACIQGERTVTESSDEPPLLDAKANSPEARPSAEAARTIGESASPQAVAVFWEHQQPTFESDVLTANLRNTTETPVVVQLELSMTEPNGRLVTRALDARSLGAQQTLTISLATAELPVQSVGVASALTLSAVYELERPAVLSATEVALEHTRLQTHAAPLYVTFDRQFTRATFRSAAAQAQANLPAATDRVPARSGAVRGADQEPEPPAYVDDALAPLLAALQAGPKPEALRVDSKAVPEPSVEPSTAPQVGVMTSVDLPNSAMPTLPALADEEN